MSSNLHYYRLYKNAWIFNGKPHDEQQITKDQCKELLQKGGWFVRNVYNFDKSSENKFWYIIKDSFYGMNELATNTRNCIRRAQKVFDIRIATIDEMLKFGYSIHIKAIKRYKYKAEIVSKEEFDNQILKYFNSGQVDFWMCFNKEDSVPIAFAINTIYDDSCEYKSMKADPAFLKTSYPFYGLIYEMNRYYLEKKGLRYVNDGARSITEHSNIQFFLESKFKFRKAYCDFKIVYKLWFKFIVYIIFPFRGVFKNQKIRGILNQEAIRRGKQNILDS